MDHPIAVLVRNGGPRLSGELDGDLASRGIETPHGDFALPLQNHVVGEGRGQFQLLIGGDCAGCHAEGQEDGGEDVHHGLEADR